MQKNRGCGNAQLRDFSHLLSTHPTTGVVSCAKEAERQRIVFRAIRLLARTHGLRVTPRGRPLERTATGG